MVENTRVLPQMICRKCKLKLRAAIPFLTLAKDSARIWDKVTDYLQMLEAKGKLTNIYVVINGEEMSTHADTIQSNTVRALNEKQALKNLNNRLKKDDRIKRIREIRQQVKMSALYQCPECECAFDTVKKLNQHLMYVSKRQCQHCNEIVDFSALEQHYREHDIDTVTCKICMESFEGITSYVKHHKFSHKKGSAFCLDCKRTFKDHIALSSHRERIHAPQSCVGCDRKFSSKVCYVKHRSICSKSERQSKFICEHCGKEYQVKDGLKMHMVSTHLVGPKFQCHICGKKCQSRGALKEHDNTHNKVLDRFVCDICGAKYSTRNGYQKHRQRHLDDGSLTDNEMKYECKRCKKKFVKEKSLNTHMKTHKRKDAVKHAERTQQAVMVKSEPVMLEPLQGVAKPKIVVKQIIFI